MQTIQDLKRRLGTTEDLSSVVSTMKALAAVNIRQYEKAAEALDDYYHTVELGLRAVLTGPDGSSIEARSAPLQRLGAVIIGSDQGMAGQLNELAAEHTRETLAGLALGRSDWTAVVVGRRLYGLFEDEAANIEKLYNVPGSAAGLTPLVQDLLVDIESWRQQPGLNHIFIFYNHHGTGAGYEPRSFRLLPLDRRWLEELRKEPWPTRNLPAHSMDREHLFSALVREYLFVALYRSLAQSLASENASRLAAMQGAEKNIQEQLDRLTGMYHQRRQMAITEELLDIVSGFEALKQERR